MIPSETQFFLALMLASTMLVVDDIPEWQKKQKLIYKGVFITILRSRETS